MSKRLLLLLLLLLLPRLSVAQSPIAPQPMILSPAGGLLLPTQFVTSTCYDVSTQDTCLVRISNGVLAMTSTGTTNGMRFPNGSNLEFGGCQWASGVFTCSTTTNGGTARNIRIGAAATTVILTTAGSDTYAFLAGGPTTYAGLTSVARGNPVIVGYGDTVAATNTGTASIATFTVGAADGSFEVGCNVQITTSTTHSFSCDVTYTDETNTGRTLVLPVAQLAGSFVTSGLITNVTGVGPYEASTMTIRAKAATAITVRTSAGGTFTGVVYNARGIIKQLS